MNKRTRRIAVVLGAATLGVLSAAPPASADHHLIKISEVYAGSEAVGSTVNDDFVELQMYADGQTLFIAHNARLLLFDSANALVQDVPLSPPDPPNGFSQRTVLIGTATADMHFGVTSDYAIPPGNSIFPAGGAACFKSTLGEIDCVSWGSFDNTMGTPHVVGSNEGGIPDALSQSIHRSTAPGCPTLLEGADDTNDSATDFAPAAPSPRPNAYAALGMPCIAPVITPPGNPTSPINPAGNVRKRKCKKSNRAAAAKKKKCKKKK